MKPTIGMIASIVCASCDITLGELRGVIQSAKIVRARRLCFWLARKHGGLSSCVIARWFGDRDHTVVLHGCGVIDEARKNPTFREQVDAYGVAIGLLSRTALAARIEETDALALAHEIGRDPRKALCLNEAEVEALANRVRRSDEALRECVEFLLCFNDLSRAPNQQAYLDRCQSLASVLVALGYCDQQELYDAADAA